MSRFDAAIFDMDGTLVDTEHLTRRVVDQVVAEAGGDGAVIPETALHGVTWKSVAETVNAAFPSACTSDDLNARCLRFWKTEPIELIPGSDAAVAGAAIPVALATSSRRDTADVLLGLPAFDGRFTAVVTADDISASKPDPEIFLLAASRLGKDPSRCVVFEDSLAGLRAAKAAGATAVAILARCADRETAKQIADHAIEDFTALPDGFLQ